MRGQWRTWKKTYDTIMIFAKNGDKYVFSQLDHFLWGQGDLRRRVYGLIDAKGKEIYGGVIYDCIKQLPHKGYAEVRIGDERFWVDREGNRYQKHPDGASFTKTFEESRVEFDNTIKQRNG
jgi:hypothetical protein